LRAYPADASFATKACYTMTWGEETVLELSLELIGLKAWNVEWLLDIVERPS
jgi:hypothetical protein